MATQHTDNSLMGRLASGDQSALESLYDRYSSILYSTALRIVGDRGVAEEVIQDSFFQLWRKAAQFESERGSLIGWLLTITRHRAISRIRRQKNEQINCGCLCDDSDLPSPGTTATALEQQIARELVSTAMTGLSEGEREAVTLAYFDGMTCEEISARTNAPLGTVKSRMRTAFRSMKKNLSDREAAGARQPSASCATAAILADIVITDQLLSRPCRARNPQQEKSALHSLGQFVATTPHQLIDAFLQLPLELCNADSSGLSLLERQPQGDPVFRWTNLAGRIQRYVGGSTPRNFSPCGVTLDRQAPQLFSYPGRYFPYLNEVELPLVEGLVIPFHIGEKKQGTIWIVSHREGWRFDSGDVRVMTGLAEFVGSALHLADSLGRPGGG